MKSIFDRQSPLRRLHRFFCAFALAGLAAACAPGTAPEDETGYRMSPARFADLPGWGADDHAAALGAFLNSCPVLAKSGAGAFGAAADWRRVCAAAEKVDRIRPGAARVFFEANFEPVAVSDAAGEAKGLITGYYEPELRGSRRKTATFAVPLYIRPPDLVSVDLDRFGDEFKGRRIAGRVVGSSLVPYHDRARIERGALRDRKLELVWVDSAEDAFFLHIQGSGRVVLRDGAVMRVGYAGTNGRPYSSVGRALIERGAVPREKMSMQAIRDWMRANPGEAQALMHTNESFVFFRELTGPGPLGAMGVALTPERSLAIDRRRFPLGMPVWLDTVLPGEAGAPFRRLMVAQDTGGAIRGAVRADVFWGPGAAAAQTAGDMQSPGRYWFLRPRAGAPAS